jgi:cytochrome o ubiquinol oxidase operon protein cyoD
MSKPNYKPYFYGYALSLVLTLNAYIAVTQPGARLDTVLMTLLVSLAVLQLIVQAIFFLHLGREPKPRWNLLSLVITIMVLLFIVLGSIWIMANLDYNMMGEHTAESILEDEGLHRE